MYSTMSRTILKMIASTVLIMLDMLILGAVSAHSVSSSYSTTAAQRDDTFTPIHTALAIDQYPQLGQTATLTCEITTVVDAPGTQARLELPADTRLVEGSLSWQGDLLVNQPVQLIAKIAFNTLGEKSLYCRALRPVDADNTWGDLAELYLTVGQANSQAGFAPIPLEQQAHLAVQAKAGDGKAVQNSPQSSYHPSYGQGVEPPQALDAKPVGVQLAPVPDAPQGSLTITGQFHYFGRNDEYMSAEMLVEVIKGDDGSHLAWCYTGLNGNYSCGPFTNPGSAGVRILWYSWVSYNPYGDILATVNPDWGTNNDISHTYKVSIPIFTFADGTHDVGDWYIVNGDTYERAFWVTTDLENAWRYIFFGTGINQNPVETTGPGTVQWKIDSTDGTYYSLGGNIHLTGIDPLSNTTADHEYGHNVMYSKYGKWFPSNDCPSPHYIQLISGYHCGWTEGWADFFPLAINNDPVYRWGSGASLNLETPTWGTFNWDNGDRVEGRVAGALWDILDNVKDGDDTYSDGGIANIWDTLFHQTDSAFSEYWAAWLARGHDNSSAGPIMALYQNTINYRLGPSNDDFASSVLVSATPFFVSGLNTTNATTQGLDPVTTCGSTSTPRQSRSVWYRFTPPGNADYNIGTYNSNYTTVLAEWTGSWGSLTQYACYDDHSATYPFSITSSLVGGTTYYIEAMSYGNGLGGSLNLAVCLAPYAPVMVSPGAGAITNNNIPTFTWNASNGADQYEFILSTNADFSTVVYDLWVNGLSYTVPSALANGHYYWNLRSRNLTGGCNDIGFWGTTRSLTVDTAPPSGTIVINGGAAYVTSTGVTLALSATDTLSGMGQMRFSNDGVSWSVWEAYGTSKAWTLTSGDGTKTVYVQYRDNAGNISGSFTDTIGLDTIAPSGTIVINGGAAYATSTGVTLALSATDTLSGMGQMRFSNDGVSWSVWEAYGTSKAWTLTSGDGTKTVYVQYRDNAGNISGSFTDTIGLDTIAPSGMIVINGGADYTTSTGVTLALSATDTLSGMGQMRFSNNDSSWSTWEAYGTSKAWTLTSGDGTKTVYVQYRDNAGNISGSFTDTIGLDTIAPSGTIVINGGAAYTTSTGVTLALSATDTLSGMGQMRFSNDGVYLERLGSLWHKQSLDADLG